MDYSEKSKIARRKILEMVYEAQTSHIASNFSVVDIATVLYEHLKEGDEVVWSKGWAAATIYYFLAKQGKISEIDLDRFAKQDDHGKVEYLGLAETNVNGVHCNGGSVGHGLPIAAGMALAQKLSGDSGTVYCILSDGELNEGSVWEAVMFARHNNLDNLVAIVDANKWQAMGRTTEVMNLEPIERRWKGFDWEWFRIDGHNHEKIEGTLRVPRVSPTVVICDTIKGKGVSFLEDHLLYHYKHLEDDEYQKALAELA